ncbi:MAG TPA: L,D-transpeptidase [Spirochaetota bacterium]|nr:L,D-transpeptidase [Spirochaetota bacterium]HOD14055.1 L,D-transpeptidase [Spirochaetota bacterium]HPG49329.1 L,D-transpeptidase [Spirochaetota bacterium]HPN12647.1 L,D-transpeptidase [Spirochaetota bacterium]
MSLCALLALQPACVSKERRIKRAFDGFNGKYVVFISKTKFLLEVYNRNLEPVAGYRIAYGSNTDRKPKLHESDNRTPEGLYRVNEILSMDADRKSSSYKTLKKMNKKFFRARDGHSKYGAPSVDLGDNAYGPRFFGLDYPNAADRKRYRKALQSGLVPLTSSGTPLGIGWGIGIHGNNDEKSVGNLSSNGCIRMYNNDIVEFEQYVQMGTPVILSPD